jgi:hypothetical protein
MDEIYASMVNGQRKQAYQQARELGVYEIPYVIDYITNALGRPAVALDLAKTCLRYLSEEVSR